MGVLFKVACCSSMLPACTTVKRGSPPGVGNKFLKSTNSLFKIFSLRFKETDALIGRRSDNWICDYKRMQAADVDFPNTSVKSFTEFTNIGCSHQCCFFSQQSFCWFTISLARRSQLMLGIAFALIMSVSVCFLILFDTRLAMCTSVGRGCTCIPPVATPSLLFFVLSGISSE